MQNFTYLWLTQVCGLCYRTQAIRKRRIELNQKFFFLLLFTLACIKIIQMYILLLYMELDDIVQMMQ